MALKKISKIIDEQWDTKEEKKPSVFLCINTDGSNMYFLISSNQYTIVSMVDIKGVSYQIPKKYLKLSDDKTHYTILQSNKLIQTGCRTGLNKEDFTANEIYKELNKKLMEG